MSVLFKYKTGAAHVTCVRVCIKWSYYIAELTSRRGEAGHNCSRARTVPQEGKAPLIKLRPRPSAVVKI